MGLTLLQQLGAGPSWLARVDGGEALVTVRPLPGDYGQGGKLRPRLDVVVGESMGIDSPNVARFLGYDTVNLREYLVREYVEGLPLDRAILTWGACPWDRAVPLIRQIAAGLSQIHAAGLVHGRLQPSNVIVAGNGQIRLMDYSLPSSLAGPTSRRHVAPEGARDALDARSDLYSLGILVYEIVTGDTVGLQSQRLSGAALQLVTWLLSLAPSARPQSAEEVVSALDGVRPMPNPAELVASRSWLQRPLGRP